MVEDVSLGTSYSSLAVLLHLGACSACRALGASHTQQAQQGSQVALGTSTSRLQEMSAAPDWMVAHMRTERTRCNAQECDAASALKWKVEGRTGDLPKGPEVSYSIPFRWSAAR